MAGFLGEAECRLDSKNRISLPSTFQRQLPPEAQGQFVVNRGFEKHLVLYPRNVWDVISNEINQLNLYIRKNRDFARYFFRGASELKLDSHNRLLLPKRLMDYAEIETNVILFGYGSKIEVWSEELYNNLLLDEPQDFASLAEEIMGGLRPGESEWQH